MTHRELFESTVSLEEIEGLTINDRAKIAYSASVMSSHEIGKDLLEGFETDAPEVIRERIKTLIQITSPEHIHRQVFNSRKGDA